MVDFKKKLAKFGKTFKTAKQRAKDEGGYGAELPDGRYLTELVSCEVTESKSSNRLQMAFEYKVIDGESKGETIRKFLGLETEDDQVWLDREMKRFGIEMESLEEAEEAAKMLNNSKAEVKLVLKTKDSGQFCYVDKVLSEIDAGDMTAEEGDEDEEDTDEDDSEEGSDNEADETDDDVDADEDSDETEDSDEDSDEEESEEEEDEEEADLAVGMSVAFEGKSGKEIAGKVILIMEKTGEVKVKSGDKTYTVKAAKLYVPEVEDADEEEVEEEDEVKPVKKTVAKKPAPAPAKKVVAKKSTVKKSAKRK